MRDITTSRRSVGPSRDDGFEEVDAGLIGAGVAELEGAIEVGADRELAGGSAWLREQLGDGEPVGEENAEAGERRWIANRVGEDLEIDPQVGG